MKAKEAIEAVKTNPELVARCADEQLALYRVGPREGNALDWWQKVAAGWDRIGPLSYYELESLLITQHGANAEWDVVEASKV